MNRLRAKSKEQRSIKCVILAAGAGTRMNSELPKSLHKIAGRTILERLLSTVRLLHIKDTAVVVGHKAELVKNSLKEHHVKVIKQRRLLGSADAVKITKPYFSKFNGNILILYTDTPLLKKETIGGLIDKHIKTDASCTLISATVKDASGYGRVLFNNFDGVEKIIEEKDANINQKNIRQINVGAYCFKAKELFDALKYVKKNLKKQEFYLTDVVSQLRQKGRVVKAYRDCAEEESLGINTRYDLSLAEKTLRRRKVYELMQEGVTFIDPETAYIDENVKIGKDSIIYPSVVIEGDVAVEKNCKIGPFAKIRGKSRIAHNASVGNFVEVVRSVVGSNTKIKHHAYVGDAEIGSNVNIGAGAVTANYDGKRKNKTIIENNVFIGVGAILIAPVKIGRHALVGAGCVVPKNKNVPANSTVVGVPARILKEHSK